MQKETKPMHKDATFVGDYSIWIDGRDLNNDPAIQEKPVHEICHDSIAIYNISIHRVLGE